MKHDSVYLSAFHGHLSLCIPHPQNDSFRPFQLDFIRHTRVTLRYHSSLLNDISTLLVSHGCGVSTFSHDVWHNFNFLIKFWYSLALDFPRPCSKC